LDTNFWGFFMTKYDEQFKLKVVKEYLEGPAGGKTLAKRYSVAHSMIRKWAGLYRAHGQDGLKKKHSSYSAEFKLSVLQHMWDNALSFGQTAAAFNIRHHAIVGVWERNYRDGGFDALVPRPRGRPKQMPAPTTKSEPSPDDEKRTRDELLAELSQLRMENAYLKKLRALVQAKQKATPPTKRK
jgi:transposase